MVPDTLVLLHEPTAIGTPPIRTSGETQSSPLQKLKFCPVTVTDVPPLEGPDVGETPVTRGARSLMLIVQHWIAPVSAATMSVARSRHVPVKPLICRPWNTLSGC